MAGERETVQDLCWAEYARNPMFSCAHFLIHQEREVVGVLRGTKEYKRAAIYELEIKDETLFSDLPQDGLFRGMNRDQLYSRLTDLGIARRPHKLI